MGSPGPPTGTNNHVNSTPIPSYLAHHIGLGFNSDDVAALIASIESSQTQQNATLPPLPAELLLQILEHVPVDYVLNWRLVCRGFRDAIDGRILYHHLHRTMLIGYMGAQHSRHMQRIGEEQYERINLLRASFLYVEKVREHKANPTPTGAVWCGTRAVFQIEDEWYRAFRQIGGAEARNGDTVEDADTQWLDTLDRLELRRPEEGFGTLRWCIKLDHAVLDMDFPLEAARNSFDVEVHLHKRLVRVNWKDMLFRFMKTETALRLMMEKTEHSAFSFSHTEDCLRAIRRQRFHSSLNPDNKVDRHIKWFLRLLKPLFGKPRYDHRISLEDVENDAIELLLFLRREAAMSPRYIAYLHQLALEHATMTSVITKLQQAFEEFQTHFRMPDFQFSIPLPPLIPNRVSRNPIAWPDDVTAAIEEQVGKWRSQKERIQQMQSLLDASNQALQLPENSFDDIDSDF